VSTLKRFPAEEAKELAVENQGLEARISLIFEEEGSTLTTQPIFQKKRVPSHQANRAT